MATLGNQTTSNSFTIAGSFGDVAAGPYTVPSPGILVTDIKVVCDNNGTSGNGRLYIWLDNSGVPGTWAIRGTSTFTLPGSQTTNTQSSLTGNTGYTGLFIPGGTKIWIGYYAASGISEFWGESSNTSELGNTADGNWNDHGPAAGIGAIAAWIDYTLAGLIRVNTGTPAAPVWTVASGVFINTGTPSAPVWTAATNVQVNQGTPASPNWVTAT